MNKLINYLSGLSLLLLVTACKKELPTQQFSYGYITASMLSLPGASTLDMYIGDEKADTVAPNIFFNPLRVKAQEQLKVTFKKKGTDEIVVDTVITPQGRDTIALSIAYSPSLGIQAWQQPVSSNIPADSTYIFLYNGLPASVKPDDMIVDAELYRSYNIEDPETHIITAVEVFTDITWEDFARNKLHPKAVMLVTYDADGDAHYLVRLRNRATGTYLTGPLGDSRFGLLIGGGKRMIFTLTTMALWDNMYLFYTESAVY